VVFDVDIGLLHSQEMESPSNRGQSTPLHSRRSANLERMRGARQQTLLEECWKPAFARYLTPKSTGLRRDLERQLLISNTDRAHQGRTPEQALMDRTLWT
jgi:hypothetical protein